MQEYIDDKDDVDKIEEEEEEDDVVTLVDEGRSRIYMGDVDCIGQVKKEGEGIKLGGGRTRVDIGGFVVSSSTIRGVW